MHNEQHWKMDLSQYNKKLNTILAPGRATIVIELCSDTWTDFSLSIFFFRVNCRYFYRKGSMEAISPQVRESAWIIILKTLRIFKRDKQPKPIVYVDEYLTSQIYSQCKVRTLSNVIDRRSLRRVHTILECKYYSNCGDTLRWGCLTRQLVNN